MNDISYLFPLFALLAPYLSFTTMAVPATFTTRDISGEFLHVSSFRFIAAPYLSVNLTE